MISRRRSAPLRSFPASPLQSPTWLCSGPIASAILAETERFLALEIEDNKALDRLAKDLKDVRNTTLWELVLRLMQDDNAKHRRILEFIRDRAHETGV
jgi:hypothetical protein